MNDEPTEEDRTPGPEVTPKLFRRWQKARRGSVPAEDMTNPVWHWLFRGCVDPYHANERFKSRLGKLIGRVDFPNEPGWAGCRLGQSRTELSDGRVFWIAGEHEDHYDPDFYIYNDVIIEQPSGELRIIGYPEEYFRPTDFHSATAIRDEAAILVIGNIGYPVDRRENMTPIYSLATDTLAITEVDSSGDQPGWIHKHQASLSDDGQSILIRGGDVLTSDGFIENIDDWSLSLNDFRWTRLTEREWPRFQVSRKDRVGLHLFQYGMLKFYQQFPKMSDDDGDDLASELGGEPNLPAFLSLYVPKVKHEAIQKDPENDDDWQSARILVNGVVVRFSDDMDRLTITVEGDLEKSIVEEIATELEQKLSLVENAECQVKRIG